MIYYVFNENRPLYALLIYGKNEQVDLSPVQRKSIGAFVLTIKSQWRS